MDEDQLDVFKLLPLPLFTTTATAPEPGGTTGEATAEDPQLADVFVFAGPVDMAADPVLEVLPAYWLYRAEAAYILTDGLMPESGYELVGSGDALFAKYGTVGFFFDFGEGLQPI